MDASIDFGAALLEHLEGLVPPESGPADLALELGVCAWMHRAGADLDGATDRLWEVRGALLEAGGLDPGVEPVPFGGRDPGAALLNLVIYLGTLLRRAAARAGCDPAAMAERAGMLLASSSPTPRGGRSQMPERRSS